METEKPRSQTARPGDLIEREWTDKFGKHYEARIVCADGRIISQIVTKHPVAGWPGERQAAAGNARRSAIGISK